MTDPTLLTTAIDNASKVADTPLFSTIIDKLTGFKLSQWAAEGEVRKKIIHDEYEKAKQNGIIGSQFIKNLRETTNLIDVAAKSASYIENNKENEIEFDNDFFWNILEHAKSISNDVMQELIAKIIAGEYNKPRSYSMSTLHTLKMLGKEELNLFEKMGELIVNKTTVPKFVFTIPEDIKPILQSIGVHFGSLQNLQNLGLFLPNDMTNIIENKERKNYALKYFDKVILYKSINKDETKIKIPDYFCLSITGEQILKHLNPKFNNEYYNWLRSNYIVDNYTIDNL